MPIPKRIILIASLFCLAGVMACWDIISGLFHGRISLNFAVFMLPVGIGLFRGLRSSQWWARFWIRLGYALCALLVLLALFFPGLAHASWFNTSVSGAAAVPFIILISFGMAGVLYVMQRLLDSEKAREFFTR